jgi:1-deoxy-D-xylulose-5-phosphate reductoisomerase
MLKRISLLGSTGSIGVSSLKVISHLKDSIEVVYLTANNNSDLLIEQALKFRPQAVCISNELKYDEVKSYLSNTSIKVFKGREGLLEIASRDNVDIMLNGLVGSAGMRPTLNAINSGVNVALSNKESLVMAGQIIKEALEKSEAELFPVDSEHSAIWQCLQGEQIEDVRNLILTGSGGPFRQRKLSTFSEISVEEALKHPNWDMGKKISIDSATMMNKGLEVIEAYWLFNFELENIKIIVHPQSIVHSMIELKDGSIKAQMGVPDMKVPIQYALMYPRHVDSPWERLNFFECQDLTFQKPDFQRFPCIELAFQSLRRKGTAGAALNLANDYSVDLFLKNKIKFTDIFKINKSCLDKHDWEQKPDLKNLVELELWVKEHVKGFS